MDCNILKTDGFTLIELSVVMGIVAILSTAVFPVAVRTLELKAAEKTVEEIKTIQQAASRFYRDQKAWPMDLSQMQTLGYVSSLWSLENPWKGPYQMSSTSNTLMVSTSVPKSVVGMLALRLPQTSVDQNTVTSVITSGGASETTTAGIIVAWSGTIADIPQGWAL